MKSDGRIDLLNAALENFDTVKREVCPGCLNSLSGDAIDKLALMISSFAQTCSMHTNAVALDFTVPPVLDAVRLTARTAATRNPLKIFPFPTITELLGRLLKIKLASTLNIVEVNQASYVVSS